MFCVNVPVLSEHTTDVEPNVSTAGSFLTIAFCLAILLTPIDKTIVTTAASPSGIAATAKATLVLNDSRISLVTKYSSTNTTIQIIIHKKPITLATCANFICNGVLVLSSLINIPAILPISVFIPVLVTIPTPLPLVTNVDENTIFF